MEKNKLLLFWTAFLNYLKKARFELIVLIAVVALDLISKTIIASTIELYSSITVIPYFLHLTYIQNRAAAFGSSFGLGDLFGESAALVILSVISFIAIIIFFVFLYKSRNAPILCRLSYALIIGGAAGNFFDRVFLGYVRDFVEIEYFGLTIFGSKTFAIFNLADAALTIGLICFAIYYIFVFRENPLKTVAEKTVLDKTDVAEKSEQISEEQNKNMNNSQNNDTIKRQSKKDE